MRRISSIVATVVAVAALGFGGGVTPARADGTSWGSGCGGPLRGESQCTFTVPTSEVAGYIAGGGAATVQVTLAVIGPDGTEILCSTSGIGAMACAGGSGLPASWVGVPLVCSVRIDTVVEPKVMKPGTYACQGI
jgi:hypothetical protein